jgi:hypothetical protein
MALNSATDTNTLIEIAVERAGRKKDNDLGLVILDAHERGAEFDADDVGELIRFSARGEHYPSGKALSELTTMFERPVKRILDPYAGYGLLIIPLAERLKPVEAHAWEANKAQSIYASMIDRTELVRWNDPTPAGPDEKYDAVVSALPVPLNRGTRSPFSSKKAGGVLSARYGSMIVDASRHLAEEGVAVFLVPGPLPAAYYEALKQELEIEGLHINLLMHIKTGAYGPDNLGGHIIRIGREKPRQIAVRETL